MCGRTAMQDLQAEPILRTVRQARCRGTPAVRAQGMASVPRPAHGRAPSRAASAPSAPSAEELHSVKYSGLGEDAWMNVYKCGAQ